ncbi:hypothetical protein Mic7113_4194 [Allocoleopsis franciscana PCC 7113]|uniref:Uncharacterized protein n=1 Tax=Allocoleopsis franciscana PCC 7113 TaxID=1173027 RepID=K9WHK4_9CYAN|nr:hypothetical protein Mic7113_4194 [Allocoleopsis franciscana PCC 7113]
MQGLFLFIPPHWGFEMINPQLSFDVLSLIAKII